jgi:hypothetical protein
MKEAEYGEGRKDGWGGVDVGEVWVAPLQVLALWYKEKEWCGA